MWTWIGTNVVTQGLICFRRGAPTDRCPSTSDWQTNTRGNYYLETYNLTRRITMWPWTPGTYIRPSKQTLGKAEWNHEINHVQNIPCWVFIEAGTFNPVFFLPKIGQCTVNLFPKNNIKKQRREKCWRLDYVTFWIYGHTSFQIYAEGGICSALWLVNSCRLAGWPVMTRRSIRG